MALFYVPDIADGWELPEEEAAHCLRVLRLSVGDSLEITDGKGNLYKAEISSIQGKHCYVQAREIISVPKSWNGNIHIAIAPTKNIDRIEWLAEKATEIGLDSLTFLNCRFSERKVVKVDRIERIVISAMKQSLKYTKPVVGAMVDFKQFVNESRPGAKYIAHCYADSERVLLKDVLREGEDATVLIGPEGDFSPQEVELAVKAGYIPVSLGSSRLRTETAGLAACHTYILKNEK
ncbi:MAG: 16S rRNA (uracil(1498)-N(3))-methyltransferase [Bacteroidaceae bacterium]|nr:16S rRNA (uracil(1498)-N(3))-methyltransferase [Bacteroidaceae bacterium]